MKKLIEKDKLLTKNFLNIENKHFVLKLITKNLNFFSLIRWNANLQLELLSKNSSTSSIVNRCLLTINKKRFNKLTGFSRHVFLKTIRSGFIPGIKKSSW